MEKTWNENNMLGLQEGFIKRTRVATPEELKAEMTETLTDYFKKLFMKWNDNVKDLSVADVSNLVSDCYLDAKRQADNWYEIKDHRSF